MEGLCIDCYKRILDAQFWLPRGRPKKNTEKYWKKEIKKLPKPAQRFYERAITDK